MDNGNIHLSQRGLSLIDDPDIAIAEYISEHGKRMAHSYDPDSCPDGYIPLCVAENKLAWHILQPKLLQKEGRDIPRTAVGYGQNTGSVLFRNQLAKFMRRAFFGRPVNPDSIATLAGAGSVLEILFYGIADPGEGILVPTPSYVGFWGDLGLRDELNLVPVHCSSADNFQLTPQLLENAFHSSSVRIRALLFTTPNNPIGTVYSAAQVEEIVDWAISKNIHVVFDEIYALSVFGGKNRFVSVGTIGKGISEGLVHHVWAFSKDFGMSGFRCGVLITENARIMKIVKSLAYWAAVSGDTQYLLGALISDTEWVDNYIVENQKLLRSNYETATSVLRREGISFFPSEAGFFFLLDVRKYLHPLTWDSEHHVWRKLLDEGNINVTPGSACHNGEPGFLRLCFAMVPSATLEVGMLRLCMVLKSLEHP